MVDRAYSSNANAKSSVWATGLTEKPAEGAKTSVRHSSGTIRFASGFSPRSYSGNAAEAALGFLADHPDLFDRGHAPILSADRSHTLGGSTVVGLRQRIDGIPVRDSEVVVVVDAQNSVQEIYSSYTGEEKISGAWALDVGEATKRGLAVVAPLKGQARNVERAYIKRSGALVPAWSMILTFDDPRKDRSVTISATDGTVIESQPVSIGAANGRVFRQNPISTPNLESLPLPALTSATSLTGVYAKVYSYYPNLFGQLPVNSFIAQLAKPDVSGNYSYSPLDLAFAEVELYYAVSTMADHFHTLGYSSDRLQIPVVSSYENFDPADGFVPNNNALFSSVGFNGGPGLFFFLNQRGLDAGYDAEVAAHEYTHSVVAALQPYRHGQTFKALNEGFADYFAASLANDSCFGEWGALIWGARQRCLRSLENPNRYPTHVVGEEHVDGNIWSGTLWEIRKQLGADSTDLIALHAIPRLPSGAEFYDAGFALWSAASDLYGAGTASQVNAVLAERGINGRAASIAAQAAKLLSGLSVLGSVEASTPGARLVADQYSIVVPPQAIGLRIRLEATGAAQAYIRFRSPIVVTDGVANAEKATEQGTDVSTTVDLSSVPELQAGTYYIAIVNTVPLPIQYRLTATVQGGVDGGTPTLSTLTSGQPASGSIPSGPFLGSRQFVFDVPAAATSATFELQGNTDVDLYASYGKAVTTSNQGFPDGDVAAESSTSHERITLSTTSIPPLRPGKYAIAISNFDSLQTAQYNVMASASTTAAPAPSYMDIPGSGSGDIDIPGASAAGELGVKQLRISVPGSADRLELRATVNSSIDVLVRCGKPVGFENGQVVFDSRYRPEVADSKLVLDRSSSPALQAGTYYISVVNWSGTPAHVSIQAALHSQDANGPKITGVLNGASFQSGFTSSTWVSVMGSNLAARTRLWGGADFSGNKLPTQLDSVSVKFNGKPGYVYYISPSQINVLAPDDSALGSVTIEVTNALGTASFSAERKNLAPAFFMFDPDGRKYIAAVHTDGAYVGKTGMFPGAAVRPAKAGEIVSLFATGFGPTSPALPSSDLVAVPAQLPTPPTITIGGVTAQVSWAGLVGSGLYQVNVQIPAVDGDAQVVCRIGEASTQDGAYLRVER
jgi:uncharacterized protein (TIGR03437 family)